MSRPSNHMMSDEFVVFLGDVAESPCGLAFGSGGLYLYFTSLIGMAKKTVLAECLGEIFIELDPMKSTLRKLLKNWFYTIISKFA